MKKIFDYIFYRFNKFYFNREGENGLPAIIGVSLFQYFVLLNLTAFILKFILKGKSYNAFFGTYKHPMIAAVFVLVFFNSIVYKNKYSILREMWKDEPILQYKMRGFFVILALILPMIMLVILINTKI